MDPVTPLPLELKEQEVTQIITVGNGTHSSMVPWKFWNVNVSMLVLLRDEVLVFPSA